MRQLQQELLRVLYDDDVQEGSASVDVVDVDGVHVRPERRLLPLQHRQQGHPLQDDDDDDVPVGEDCFVLVDVGGEDGQPRPVPQRERRRWLKRRRVRVVDVLGKWGRPLGKVVSDYGMGMNGGAGFVGPESCIIGRLESGRCLLTSDPIQGIANGIAANAIPC